MARKDWGKLTWFGLRDRAQAGALLLALLGVFSIAHQTYKISPQDDPVSAFDLQVKLLLHDLPAHGAVGYVSDATMVDDSPSFWEFLYLQYGLAPLIVVDSPEYPFVIGNFHGARWDAKASQLKLTPVKDYGNGLVLFRGPSR
jgi:hypothetical protein